ncbi:MAG TPA: hypothetical protein VEH81_00480 [Ktedonobacteraceae bacterium]|nr:hypothetical protein [Ktedonobacteraceae bacterium]
MSMNEFYRKLPGEGDDQLPLFIQEYPLPADFDEEDIAFVEEFRDLFVPEEEELSLFNEPTLSAFEDTHDYSLEPGFEQRTSARVFQRLNLRRRLFHTPQTVFGLFIYGSSSIFTRLSLLASAAAVALIVLCTVAFTAPSFAAGLTILLHGARGGVYLANSYPKNVHKLTHKQKIWQNTAKNQSDQISLLSAQQQLHFQMYWPESMPNNYALDSMYLYQTTDTPWADGPIMELIYNLHGIASKGTGQIVIREFKPNEEVLQLVQDDAAYPIQMNQQGQPQAIYVDGQWILYGKTFLWITGGRCELIYQQNGVLFWIASDQRDGIGEKDLWKIAMSLHTTTFSHTSMLMIGKETLVTQASLGDVRDAFATDVLVIYPDGSPNGAYIITVSSYLSEKPVQKTVNHDH